MNRLFLIVVLLSTLFVACKQDYLTDGGVANPKVNLTTYDYLKTNPLFDTLVILIDKAGLKDQVNGSVTFIAPTDYSITNYVNNILSDLRVFDPTAKYTINNIPSDSLKMLVMYLMPGLTNRDQMTKEGIVYATPQGAKYKLSLELVDLYGGQLANKPEMVFFSKKIGERWDGLEEIDLPNEEADVKDIVRTSGIVTQTGIVHVLQGDHVLFFNRRKY